MMTITYKDVGQGDSIIIEWEIEGDNKIAIIDCNKKGRTNPVLDHIISMGYKQIELIVLSHPHKDHYSGLLGLLNYAEAKGIIIKKLVHTLNWSASNYWKYFEVSSSDSRLLSKTISKWAALKGNTILQIDGLTDGKPLPLDKGLMLRCLAPSHDDAELYQNIVDNDADKNIKKASQAANHLSTVFLLTFNNTNILLTSDAENETFQNILKRNPNYLNQSMIQLCQLPHHGSDKNHLPEFWQTITTSEIKHAAISAGKHRTYNHPAFIVLKYFYDIGYKIHCTNILNGMAEFTRYLKTVTERSLELDPCSSLAEEYRRSSDRIFEIINDEVVFE